MIADRIFLESRCQHFFRIQNFFRVSIPQQVLRRKLEQDPTSSIPTEGMWPKEGDMENSLVDRWGSSMSKGRFMVVLRKETKGIDI